jgi:hypothetical protein
MKKLFLAVAFVAALIFSVAPSYALNGMPDDVPGCQPLTPFFLVDKANLNTGGAGLDTLMVIQEVGGKANYTANATKLKGYVHMVIRNYLSVEIVDVTFPYTPNDVLPFSVKDLLRTYMSAEELASIEVTLGGKTYYTGYIDWENSLPVNNLVAFMYLVDLPNGWAAANTAPVFELADDAGYDPSQQWTSLSDYYGERVLEPFSGSALAVSEYRERNNDVPAETVPSSFRLMPRYFLKDANAQTWIPIWSDSNKGTKYPITCYLYDENENVISKTINIPYELNWLNIRTLLPVSGPWASVTGGWLDIPFPKSGRGDVQWLAYSYQTASSPSAAANWSVLTSVHREAGTID